MAAVDVNEVAPIVDAIRPLLAGKPPEIQGAVIADLLSIYLAGHHADVREEILRQTVQCARDLIRPNIGILFPNGAPPGWEPANNG